MSVAVKQSLGLTALLVRDYDEALNFFVGVLGFNLIEDTYIPGQNKRWVVVAPPGSCESGLVLRNPKEEYYRTVAVFKDLYGNQWDLLQPAIRVSSPDRNSPEIR
jgi:hypothetical protein